MSINRNPYQAMASGPIAKTGDTNRVEVQPAREISQLYSPDGEAYAAYGTHALWLGDAHQFAPWREGNKVAPFTAGEDYFKAVAAAMKAAAAEIWIAGWEVNWDVTLIAGTATTPPERLIDVLLKAASENKDLKIYVMPWAGSMAVPTYAHETEIALKEINQKLGRNCVFVKLSRPLADQKTMFFSHHQKHVVIDRKLAFVGGMDLTYGRRDDASFNLVANTGQRETLERYNGCVVPMLKANPAHLIDPKVLVNVPGNQGHREHGSDAIDASRLRKRNEALSKLWEPTTQQYPSSFDGQTLDANIQPRMPWQDTHVQIEGPAVADVALNFAARWNSISNATKLKLPDPASSYPTPGKCMVQVLRSAPADMCKEEYKAMSEAERKQFVPRGVSGRAQDNVYEAMLNLIDRAQFYIYIENQFFVSDYGEDGGYTSPTPSRPVRQIQDGQSWLTKAQPSATKHLYFWEEASTRPQNQIGHALADRIKRAILAEGHLPFHAFITLPVHPEGKLNDPVVMTQVHQTMQSLVFGEHSLINEIRRALKMKQLLDQGEPDWIALGNAGYADIPVENCADWLTLLNLRNWACLSGGGSDFYVTEQIYVHNKMMIVDDLYAIVGSANINERSLLGSRDSELSVLLVDADTEMHDLRQDGKPRPTRNFARTLRQQVWSKIFGLTAGGDKAATTLQDALEHPASPVVWKAIREVAAANTKRYEDAFAHIPRSLVPSQRPDGEPEQASIWPVREPELMPFSKAFWDTRYSSPAAKNLTGVKGFITLLPLGWTAGEFNQFDYDPALYSQNVPEPSANNAQVASAASHVAHEGNV